MRIQLTRIGNSRGIRIPKPLIEECGLGESVELRATPEGLVITPARRPPRVGWKQAFERNLASKNDLLMDLPANRFDHEEWKW